MSATLIMSAFGALALTSGIALVAREPAEKDDRISAAEREQALAAMRGRARR